MYTHQISNTMVVCSDAPKNLPFKANDTNSDY